MNFRVREKKTGGNFYDGKIYGRLIYLSFVLKHLLRNTDFTSNYSENEFINSLNSTILSLLALLKSRYHFQWCSWDPWRDSPKDKFQHLWIRL